MAGSMQRTNAFAVDSAKFLAFATAAGAGAFLFDGLQEMLPSIFPVRNDPFYLIAQSGLWFGFVGAGVAMGITVAQAWYGKRLGIDLRLFVATLSGFVVGMVAGAFGQLIYNAGAQTSILQSFAWALTGSLLGFALSFQVPNLGKIRAAISGLIGGAVGCVLFLTLSGSAMSEALARMIGVALVGCSIGAMISLGESLFRSAWLELQYASGDVRQVTLGAVPVAIGSDKSRCTVVIADIAPMAFRFRMANGRVTCEDMSSRKMDAVSSGETRRLGAVRATVFCKQASKIQPSRPAPRSAPTAQKEPRSPKRMPIRRPPRR